MNWTQPTYFITAPKVTITQNDFSTTINNLYQYIRNLTINNTTTYPLTLEASKCCGLSYTLGTTHFGLTGESSLSVTGVAGFLLAITVDLPSAADQVGNPAYLWNRGWFSVSNADGLLEEKRLVRTAQLWFPAHPELATQLAWWLPAGLVVDVTELIPA